MPKATKKKKEKTADFSKAKLKLGKGKKLPANQIDTSFKARSIALPAQSIALEKDHDVPTTKRKLTFNDLVTQLKHYNSGVKKDALLGLRELLEAHPNLIESSLAMLIGSCVRLIASEDASVRRTLFTFFTWLFPRASIHSLAPHSSSLLLFTTSGQTHIFPEIRIDAVRLLDLYLETFPDLVVCGWRDGKSGHGRRVLDGYLSILSVSTKLVEGDASVTFAHSITGVVLSTASKLIVLKSLSKFLRIALSSAPFSSDESIPAILSNSTSCFSSAFPDQTTYKNFDALFLPTTNLQPGSRPATCLWKAEVSEDAEDFAFVCNTMQFKSIDASYTLRDLQDTISSTTRDDFYLDSRIGDQRPDFEMRLAMALHPVLLSNFLDSAPSVFTPSSVPLQTELGIISAIGSIYHSLYGALLQDTRSNTNTNFLSDSLQVLLERMTPYFPFLSNPLVKRDIQIEQTLQDLNIIFCELTSLLVLACSAPLVTQPQLNTKRLDGMSIQTQISRVKNFAACLLRGNPMSTNTVGRQITAQEYIALLPTLWMLLNSDPGHAGVDEDIDIICVLLDHARQVSSAAAAKRPTVDFLVRLVLLETTPQSTSAFKVNDSVEGLQKFEEWVIDLPKTLWELGGTNLPCTEIILRFLLRLFQRHSPIGNTNVAARLCARLIPYFTITHPVHGTLLGPFTKLEDTAVQRLALDAVVTIMSRTPAESHRPLDAAVHRAVEGSAHATYWVAATETV